MKLTRPLAKHYCEMCDKWVSVRARECPDCGAETQRAVRQSPVVGEAQGSDAVPTSPDAETKSLKGELDE